MASTSQVVLVGMSSFCINDSPGHPPMVHVLFCLLGPSQPRILPKPVYVHVRVLHCIPRPQETEHLPQLPHQVQFSPFLCSKILNWNCEWFKMSKVAHSKTKHATIGRHWYIKLLAVLYSITIKQGSIGTKTKPSLCATYTR